MSFKKLSLRWLWCIAALFVVPRANAQETLVVRRLTQTPAQSINLHPFISGDGRRVIFESSADLLRDKSVSALQTFVANVESEQTTFSRIARSRAASTALSQSGQQAAFASKDDPLQTNADGNSEIFYFDGAVLHQLTDTQPNSIVTRVDDGNFDPSLSDDGLLVAFTSNRDLVSGGNVDASREVFIYEVAARKFKQLTNTPASTQCERAQLSGDGQWVVYLLAEQDNLEQNRQLILQNVSSGEVRFSHTNDNLKLAGTRSLSDSGARLVFSATDEKGSAQVFLYDNHTRKIRQIAQLANRAADATLRPSISGDGSRLAFATNRSVNKLKSDGGTQVYVYDFPAGELIKVTDASPQIDASEIAISLNDDGTKVAFNFSRLLSESISAPEFKDAAEIYLAEVPLSKRFADDLQVFNAASLLTAPLHNLAPGMIAIARGSHLASESIYAKRQSDDEFPLELKGTTVRVNNRLAPVYYVSPTEVAFYVPQNTSVGNCSVTVANPDGFETRGIVQVEAINPGIFTVNGDGTDDAVVFDDANSLLVPSALAGKWFQRISLFGTGFGTAQHATLVIGGREYATDAAVNAVENFRGLNQITFTVPQALRGAGEVAAHLQVDHRASNAFILRIAAVGRDELIINEILYDPPNGLAGDANRDGQRNGADEFIELYNVSSASLQLLNWSLATKSVADGRERTVHKFTAHIELPPGAALIVFGGGDLQTANSFFGGAQVFQASAGNLSLNNTSMIVVVRDATGTIVSEAAYGPNQAQAADQSLTRSPEATGLFVPHLSTGDKTRRFSPGTRADGTPYNSPTLTRIAVLPQAAVVDASTQVNLTAKAFGIVDDQEIEIPFVDFTWDVGDSPQQILSHTFGHTVTINPIRAGTVTVRARAGVHEAQTQIVVNPVVASIELVPAAISFSVNQKIDFTATARDATGAIVSDLQFEFLLQNADAPNVAAIENAAHNQVTVRGDNVGTVWLIARFVNPGSEKVVASEAKLVIGPAPSVDMPAAGEVVINEAVTAFAKSAAEERQDFIELFNNTSRPLDLSGLSVSFRPSGAGAAVSTFALPGAAGSKTTIIQPRSYYLIVNGAQTFGVAADADASAANFDLNNTSGGIQLVLNGVKLDGLAYQGGSIALPEAFKIFGEGKVFEFTGGTTNDIIRVPNAHDSDDNASDYQRNGTIRQVSPKAINPQE